MNVAGAVFTAYQFPELSDCSVGRLCGPPGYWSSFAAFLSRPDDGNFWDIFGSPFPIIDKNGKWELFVTACSRTPAQGCTLWVNRKITTGSGWWDVTGWVKIGGNFISDPDGVINASGGLQVFAVGSDLQLYYWWQSAPESSTWKLSVLPAPAGITWASVPNVLRNTDGSLQVFIKGSDGALWSRRETSPATATSAGGWAAWEYLGGSLRDF